MSLYLGQKASSESVLGALPSPVIIISSWWYFDSRRQILASLEEELCGLSPSPLSSSPCQSSFSGWHLFHSTSQWAFDDQSRLEEATVFSVGQIFFSGLMDLRRHPGNHHHSDFSPTRGLQAEWKYRRVGWVKISQGGLNHKRTPWFDSWNPYSNSGKHRPVIVGLIIEHSSSVRLLVMTSKDHRFSKISYRDQHHDEDQDK